MKRISVPHWKAFFLICFGLMVLFLGANFFQTHAQPLVNPSAVDVSPLVYPSLSPSVSSLQPVALKESSPQTLASPQEPFIPVGNGEPDILAALVGNGNTPAPLLTFEGIDGNGTFTPPDPVGDVGPNHFVQMVNVSFQIWDKGDPDQGIPPTILQPATPFNQLFTGTGDVCETHNDGAPTVIYDDLADRWVLSQFVLGNPFTLCIAVSTTPDPMGTYYRYEFPMPANPDYPKLAAWPDAYYAGTNTGQPHEFFAHAFDRTRMLAGLPAFRQSVGNLDNYVMPADADGQIPPPANSPGIFYTMYDNEFPNHPTGVDRLAVYEFHVDWENSNNSTLTLAQEIPVTSFNYTVCGYSLALPCIPQPGTAQKLDSLSYWPMFRFQYRDFGNYGALVGNFTVDVNGQDRAGIRWFEIHRANGSYTLFQEGTFAPDTDHRWMGSLAMDKAGNLALGYNVSSATTIPSIRYTSHLTGDPLGTMAAEATLWSGSGVQTETTRWGDFSNLVVDPLDGCHFWFTGEYHDVNDTGFHWNTRVGVFQLPGCEGNTGTLSGLVTDGDNAISGVEIQAQAYLTQTGSTTSDPLGNYQLLLPEGTYDLFITAFGYLPNFALGVDVISGTLTTQNFTLSPAPAFTISGKVTDAAAGWPLYAKIEIDGYPGSPIWTNPATGAYQVSLPKGVYSFEVHPFNEGYFPLEKEVYVEGDLTQSFDMAVDTQACVAPGYVFNGTRQNFNDGTLPFGWGIKDNIHEPPQAPQVWQFNDPGGRGNLTGGTGAFAIVDSDYFGNTFGETSEQDTTLVTAFVDFSNLNLVYLTFDTDFKVWDGNITDEKAQVDVSIDGGDNWINVWQRDMEGGDFNGHVLVDLSPIAANKAFVLLRFHYFDAQYDYWWQIDNIAYGALTCDPIPGGMVVGNVIDENFGNGLNDLEISTSTSITATTQTTPNDPSLLDGFYTLFAPQGLFTITASAAGYGTLITPLLIEDGTTIQQDFILPAGWLDTDPGQSSLSLGFGYTATLPVTLENTGHLTATFSISQVLNPNISPSWLTVEPSYGILPDATDTVINLNLSAIPITQTGFYTAQLIIQNDTPYGNLTYPVTLFADTPLPALAITPDQTREGAPGTMMTYPVVITNTGNIPETFAAQITNQVWDASVNLSNIFLNPGSSAMIQVEVNIPNSAFYLAVDNTTLQIEGTTTGTSAITQLITIARSPYSIFLPSIHR